MIYRAIYRGLFNDDFTKKIVKELEGSCVAIVNPQKSLVKTLTFLGDTFYEWLFTLTKLSILIYDRTNYICRNNDINSQL